VSASCWYELSTFFWFFSGCGSL